MRLDLDRLERNAARPFDPVGEVSPLRRQWALLALGAAILTRLRLAAAIEQLRQKPGGWNSLRVREDAT